MRGCHHNCFLEILINFSEQHHLSEHLLKTAFACKLLPKKMGFAKPTITQPAKCKKYR